MRIKTFLKILIGLILITSLCFAAVKRLQIQEGQASSHMAAIEAHRDTIGTVYAGTITKQFVEAGQHVTAGQELFYIKSTVLSDQLRDKKIDPSSINYQLTASGEIIVQATKPGIIDTILYTGGSFVPANQTLATIIDTKSYVVKSEFLLSSKQFNNLGDNPQMDILIRRNTGAGNIRSITTQSGANGVIDVTVVANFVNPPSDIREGLAVRTVLHLNHTTLHQKLAALWPKL